jgi:hypothetical protein
VIVAESAPFVTVSDPPAEDTVCALELEGPGTGVRNGAGIVDVLETPPPQLASSIAAM